MNYAYKSILAATATAAAIGQGATVAMFDTETSQRDASSVERHSAMGQAENLPLIDFDSAGWFENIMMIPGEEAYITFKRRPQLKMSLFNKVLIPEWGVSVEVSKFSPAALRLAVIRKYRMLDDKARRRVLTDEERREWKNLLADSDYGDYCQRTAPKVKVSGIRQRQVGNEVEVLWSEGESETVGGTAAAMLSVVEDGEEFTAYARFINRRLSDISDVVPVGKPEEVNFSELFGLA